MEMSNAKPDEGLENRLSGRDGLGVPDLVLPPTPSGLADGAWHTSGTHLGPCRLHWALGGPLGLPGGRTGDFVLREQLPCRHGL